MNNTKDAAYCRLCAELKHHNKLTNLQTDEETCQKVVHKLTRFNIVLDFQENVLPKTVCLLCVKSLDRAFAFVTAVEQAQAFLSDYILVQINGVETDSCYENALNEPPEEKKVVQFIEENRYSATEVNDHGTHLSVEYFGENKFNVFDNYCMIDSNTEDCEKEMCDIPPPLKQITDIKDECDEPPEICHVEDSQDFIKDTVKRENDSEPVPVEITVCTADYVNKSYNKDMDKNIQCVQLQFQDIPPEPLTTKESETKINNKQKRKKNIKKTEKKNTKKKTTEKKEPDVEHIKKTWEDYEWKCSYCETIFQKIDELQKHSMQHHNSCNPYKCIDCGTKRSNLRAFMKHARGHRNYLLYSCYKCFKKFPKLYQAGHHKKKVHENSDFVCPGCFTPFCSDRELKDHVSKYFNQWTTKTPVDFKCTVCNKITENAYDLKKHLRIHQKKEHVCETCGKCYVTKKTLKDHLVTHSDVKDLYHCDVCNTSFSNKFYLQSHKIIHTGIKPYTCDHCGKGFYKKAYMGEHMKIHMNSLPFKCTVCNKQFRNSTQLKCHSLQHTGEKPYGCDICSRDFTSLSNRNKHMRRKHNIEMTKKREPIVKEQTEPAKSDLSLAGCPKIFQYHVSLMN